jgi:transcriptional regulator with XRE-family HTH domain
MSNRAILAENLKSLTKYAGIKSQSKLARLSGVSQTEISNILYQKKAASVDTLERLANGLGCENWILLAPSTLLEHHEPADFAPLVHCYMSLPRSDQKAVWGVAHELFESNHGFFSSPTTR